MWKIGNIFSLILLGVFFTNCSQNNSDSIIENADFDPKTFTLKVNYLNNPDTSLLEIIALSNIRKSGYGLLLNVENYYSKSELDTLKRKFQKLDINAVHSFNISLEDSLQTKIQIAIDGAQFIWILDNKIRNWQTESLGNYISGIQTQDKSLIVLSKN